MSGPNGYIRVWRKLRQNPVYTNSKAVHVWLECLMRASFKESERYLKREKIKLEPGQFVMGREEFGDKLGMSGSTAWYWLQEFESDNMIDIKTTTKGSIVTIKNWEDYQKVDSKVDREKTADKQQKNSNKNGKNVKKGNKTTTNKISKEINQILEVYSEIASSSEALINHTEPVIKDKKKHIKNRLKDGFTVQQCVDAVKGVPKAYNSDKSWWSRQRGIESLFKTGKGKYIEKFSRWYNGDLIDSGLLESDEKESKSEWAEEDFA